MSSPAARLARQMANQQRWEAEQKKLANNAVIRAQKTAERQAKINARAAAAGQSPASVPSSQVAGRTKTRSKRKHSKTRKSRK